MTEQIAVSFWDTVVVNAAPIIIALTGFGAMLGGFWLQKRMMDKQNQTISFNAAVAEGQRVALNTKMEAVRVATDGMKDELVKSTAKASKAEGIVEGRAAEKAENNGQPG